MTIPISELEKLEGYSFSLQSYVVNHSTLTLYAASPDSPPVLFRLYFADVSYVQMPLGWKSPFQLGSDSEREGLIKKIGLPLRGISSGVYLYKSTDGTVMILGALMGIEAGASQSS